MLLGGGGRALGISRYQHALILQGVQHLPVFGFIDRTQNSTQVREPFFFCNGIPEKKQLEGAFAVVHCFKGVAVPWLCCSWAVVRKHHGGNKWGRGMTESDKVNLPSQTRLQRPAPCFPMTITIHRWIRSSVGWIPMTESLSITSWRWRLQYTRLFRVTHIQALKKHICQLIWPNRKAEA